MSPLSHGPESPLRGATRLGRLKTGLRHAGHCDVTLEQVGQAWIPLEARHGRMTNDARGVDANEG